MSKKTTALLIIAVVLAVCACILPAVMKEPVTSEDVTTEETVLIDNIHMSKVAGAALVNENGSVALIVEDNTITFNDPPKDTGVSDSIMKTFLYYVSHMPAVKKLGTVDSPEDYGLDKPRATVSVIEKNGDMTRIYLGDETPIGEGWYAATEKDSCVYVVDDITARMLQYGVDDFRDLDVLPVLPSDLTLNDMTGFRLTHGKEILEVYGEQEKGSMHYILSAPFEAALNWETVASLIYTPVSCLDECTYVSTGTDPAEYGLTGKDAYTLTCVIRGTSWTLHFADAGDGSFYVCRDGSEQIVRVSSEMLSYLDLKASDLVSDTVYSVSAANIDTVHIVTENVDQLIRVSGVGESLYAEFGDRHLNQKETLSLVKTLTMLPAAGMLNDETDISEDPVLHVEFSLRDGTANILDVIPVTRTECAVMIDGSCSAVTLRSTVDEVIREIQAGLSD